MTRTNRWRRGLSLLACTSALVFLSSTGCSRQIAVPAEAGTTQTPESPFQAGKDDSAILPAAFSGADTSNPSDNPPFREAQNLPAGTLLAVRLNAPITREKKSIDQVFEAILDEPVVIGGMTLLPRGSVVSGHVESLRTSKIKPGRGYVRLVLESVRLTDANLPIQTASLFVRPAAHSEGSPAALLEKGHRLAFRLAEPVFTPRQPVPTTR